MTDEIFVIINRDGSNTPVEYTKYEAVARVVVDKKNKNANLYSWYYKKVPKVRDWQEQEVYLK